MSTSLPDGLSAELHRRLVAHHGDRLVRAVLFGPYARGEATEASGVDVLVVLRGEVDRWAEAKATGEITIEVAIECGKFVTFVVVGEDRAQADRAFTRNVRQDGVPLVA